MVRVGNDLTAKETFVRMAITVYDSAMYGSYSLEFNKKSCYATVCHELRENIHDPTDEIVILGDSGIATHAILIDKDGKRLVDTAGENNIFDLEKGTYHNEDDPNGYRDIIILGRMTVGEFLYKSSAIRPTPKPSQP